jgi:hypothetical protein
MKEQNKSKRVLKKKFSMKWMIIGVSVIIVIALIAGYFYINNRHNRFGQRVQLNQQQIDEVTSFFSNTTDANQINDYCTNNRPSCVYYCRTIDSSNPYCNQIMNQTRTPTPQ